MSEFACVFEVVLTGRERSTKTCTVTSAIADRSGGSLVFLSFFHFSIFNFSFFVVSFISLPRGPSGLPLEHRFFLQNLDFKQRFWVTEEEERKKKKEERADRNRSPSTVARTRTFCYSRAWKPHHSDK